MVPFSFYWWLWPSILCIRFCQWLEFCCEQTSSWSMQDIMLPNMREVTSSNLICKQGHNLHQAMIKCKRKIERNEKNNENMICILFTCACMMLKIQMTFSRSWMVNGWYHYVNITRRQEYVETTAALKVVKFPAHEPRNGCCCFLTRVCSGSGHRNIKVIGTPGRAKRSSTNETSQSSFQYPSRCLLPHKRNLPMPCYRFWLYIVAFAYNVRLRLPWCTYLRWRKQQDLTKNNEHGSPS